MNKLTGIINSMDEKELKSIQKDLYEGNIGYLIKRRLSELEKDIETKNNICPVCGTRLTEGNIKYTLVFGPTDFKKKASFDEIDCLRFFVSKLDQSDRYSKVDGLPKSN